MTYKNPRLKHVKKIRDLASKMPYSSFTNDILDQCNLLLETEKAKKRKRCLHNKTKLVFERGGRYLGEFCENCKKYVSRSKNNQSPKEQLEDIEVLYGTIRTDKEFRLTKLTDVIDKQIEIIDRLNILSKRN